VYYDDDADLSLLDGKTVAILGYGSQGHAHSLNLKDSGVDVVVGLREGSASVEKARAAGLEVTGIADAASRGDIVMVLLPDEKHGEVYREEIADGIAPGNLLLFGHGFSIHYDEIEPPPRSTSGSSRRRAPGHLVRRQYVEARGVRAWSRSSRTRPATRRPRRSPTRRRSAARARRDRDDVQGRDRDRPVRRAGRAVRRRLRARQGGYETLVDAGYDPSWPTSSASTSSS
jgi:ketol-acid reductoisomerase